MASLVTHTESGNALLGAAVLEARMRRTGPVGLRPDRGLHSKPRVPPQRAPGKRVPRAPGTRRSEVARLGEWIGVTRMTGAAKALVGDAALTGRERAVAHLTVEALGKDADADYSPARDGNRGQAPPTSRTTAFRALLLAEAVRRANEPPAETTLRPLGRDVGGGGGGDV